MYESYLLQRIEWVDERTFIAVIYREHRHQFTIRSWWIPYIRPRLSMKYLGKAVSEDREEQMEGAPGPTSRST